LTTVTMSIQRPQGIFNGHEVYLTVINVFLTTETSIEHALTKCAMKEKHLTADATVRVYRDKPLDPTM